ncbi:MAG: DUF4974 domain-containing protein [Chitinophagaceae bacterium]|nr:DUF4974 domain-containing protein [Chitinophagaceae bacterium]
MRLNESRIKHLLRLFADNKASEGEIKDLLALLRTEEGDKILETFILQLREEPDQSYPHVPVDWDNVWNNIHQSALQPERKIHSIKWLYSAAAVILVLLSVGAFYYFNDSPTANVAVTPVQPVENDIQPGGEKAILTLANGSQIVLDDASPGKVAEQGNAEIIKDASGHLVYKGTGQPVNEVMYNTVSTPRGGQYKLVLPDGSGVWLNAISSIKYPTAFTGTERMVEITGEAYFEVSKDAKKPFRVIVNRRSFSQPDQNDGSSEKRNEIQVLGTHFNVNAYSDEPSIKTTLVEGSVKVINGNSSSVIKPGQQSQVGDNGKINVISDANLSEALAWKDGRFEFNDADLKTILRQVMRWYNVEVEYQGALSERYFTAAISRNKTLSGLLNILKQSDVDFQLNGNKLIVRP